LPPPPALNVSKEKINFVPLPNEELKLDNLQPVPVKKTLLIVNTFIVNTTAFLNKFVATCEDKLHKLRTDINRMEVTLNLLEGKLQSIDWLRNAQNGNIPYIPIVEDLKDNDFKDDRNIAPPPAPILQTQESSTQIQSSSSSADDAFKSNPQYAPWFKMLKIKVPPQAVRNKMAMTGLSDDIIEKIIDIGTK